MQSLLLLVASGLAAATTDAYGQKEDGMDFTVVAALLLGLISTMGCCFGGWRTKQVETELRGLNQGKHDEKREAAQNKLLARLTSLEATVRELNSAKDRDAVHRLEDALKKAVEKVKRDVAGQASDLAAHKKEMRAALEERKHAVKVETPRGSDHASTKMVEAVQKQVNSLKEKIASLSTHEPSGSRQVQTPKGDKGLQAELVELKDRTVPNILLRMARMSAEIAKLGSEMTPLPSPRITPRHSARELKGSPRGDMTPRGVTPRGGETRPKGQPVIPKLPLSGLATKIDHQDPETHSASAAKEVATAEDLRKLKQEVQQVKAQIAKVSTELPPKADPAAHTGGPTTAEMDALQARVQALERNELVRASSGDTDDTKQALADVSSSTTATLARIVEDSADLQRRIKAVEQTRNISELTQQLAALDLRTVQALSKSSESLMVLQNDVSQLQHRSQQEVPESSPQTTEQHESLVRQVQEVTVLLQGLQSESEARRQALQKEFSGSLQQTVQDLSNKFAPKQEVADLRALQEKTEMQLMTKQFSGSTDYKRIGTSLAKALEDIKVIQAQYASRSELTELAATLKPQPEIQSQGASSAGVTLEKLADLKRDIHASLAHTNKETQKQIDAMQSELSALKISLQSVQARGAAAGAGQSAAQTKIMEDRVQVLTSSLAEIRSTIFTQKESMVKLEKTCVDAVTRAEFNTFKKEIDDKKLDKQEFQRAQILDSPTKSISSSPATSPTKVVEKPWVGFHVRDEPGNRTVYVTDVVAGGPAQTSGVRDDDELTHFGGHPTPSLEAFRSAFKKVAKVGVPVTLNLCRDKDGVDNASKFTVTIKPLPWSARDEVLSNASRYLTV
eukprot:NODE_247_length_2838_cov_8.689871_g231_i0.p1 GENE.NODE_247_length_2838_cov_8.689871_g231_i0~~NODE_247_length_2838_cov_8.689871_g231_i0.p1  ORF type:complete len:851 (-),score=184.91 NODE_247_length_2838_cov_8.689871_g231_i0:189-2741(-)